MGHQVKRSAGGVPETPTAVTRLDEALEMTFPASDPVAVFRSEERVANGGRVGRPARVRAGRRGGARPMSVSSQDHAVTPTEPVELGGARSAAASEGGFRGAAKRPS
jgi:hypothetical protein